MNIDKQCFLARYGTRQHALDAIQSDDIMTLSQGLMNSAITHQELQAYRNHSKPSVRTMADYLHGQMMNGNLPKKDGMK